MATFIEKVKKFYSNKSIYQRYCLIVGLFSNLHTFAYTTVEIPDGVRHLLSAAVLFSTAVILIWSYFLNQNKKCYYDCLYFLIGQLLTLQLFLSSLDIGSAITHALTFIAVSLLIFIAFSVYNCNFHFNNFESLSEHLPEYDYNLLNIHLQFSTAFSTDDFNLDWKYLPSELTEQNFKITKDGNNINEKTIIAEGLDQKFISFEDNYEKNILTSLVSTVSNRSVEIVKVMKYENDTFNIYYKYVLTPSERICIKYFKFYDYFRYHYHNRVGVNHPMNHIKPYDTRTDDRHFYKRIYGLNLLLHGLDYYKDIEKVRSESNHEDKLKPMNYLERVETLKRFINNRKESNNRDRLRKYLQSIVNWYHGKKYTYNVTPEYRLRWKKHVDWIIGSERVLSSIHIRRLVKTDPLYEEHELSETTDYNKITVQNLDLTDASSRLKEIPKHTTTVHTNDVSVFDTDESTTTFEYNCLPDRSTKKFKEPSKEAATPKNKKILFMDCNSCFECHEFEYSKTRKQEYEEAMIFSQVKTQEWTLVNKVVRKEKRDVKNPFKNTFAVLKFYDTSKVSYGRGDNLPMKMSPDARDIKKLEEIKKKKNDSNNNKNKESVEKSRKMSSKQKRINDQNSKKSALSIKKQMSKLNCPKYIKRELITRCKTNTSQYYSRRISESTLDDKYTFIPVHEAIKNKSHEIRFYNDDYTLFNIIKSIQWESAQKMSHKNYVYIVR